MDTATIAILVFLLLFGLLIIRVPVAFALLVAGFTGLFLLRDLNFTLLSVARTAYSAPANYSLLVVPLFIALGIFAKHGRLATDGFAIAHRLLHRVPGGLAMATVFSCALFGAVSGSSVATVAAIGPTAILEMRRYGYSTEVAAGVVGAAGTLGVLIPPSIALVLFAIISGESIGLMLIAGIVPGIISAVIYAAVIYWRAQRRPDLFGLVALDYTVEQVRRESGSTTDLQIGFGRALSTIIRVTIIFAAVIGGMYAGIFTVVEAAAIGALIALIYFIADIIADRLSPWIAFRKAILETVSLSSMTFGLLLGGAVLTYFLVMAQIPNQITQWVIAQDLPPLLIVVLILLMFIPMGMFLDPISMLLIGIPLTYPIVTELGYDGIWFGILVVKLIEVGLVTPPFGLNAFVVAGAANDVSVEQAFRGILWFVPIDLLTIALFFVFPGIIMWLPNMANL
jgi:C4-dicarboxylate transporter DctM subunit